MAELSDRGAAFAGALYDAADVAGRGRSNGARSTDPEASPSRVPSSAEAADT